MVTIIGDADTTETLFLGYSCDPIQGIQEVLGNVFGVGRQLPTFNSFPLPQKLLPELPDTIRAERRLPAREVDDTDALEGPVIYGLEDGLVRDIHPL
jgi:hypothetical protein